MFSHTYTVFENKHRRRRFERYTVRVGGRVNLVIFRSESVYRILRRPYDAFYVRILRFRQLFLRRSRVEYTHGYSIERKIELRHRSSVIL